MNLDTYFLWIGKGFCLVVGISALGLLIAVACNYVWKKIVAAHGLHTVSKAVQAYKNNSFLQHINSSQQTPSESDFS